MVSTTPTREPTKSMRTKNAPLPSFACTVSLVVAALALPACNRPRPGANRPGTGRAPYDRSAIDVNAFGTDPTVRRRVLHMPFGEAAARLGALRFEAKSSLVFSRSGQEYEETDNYRLAADPQGDIHLN